MSNKNNKKRTVAIGIAALGVAGLAISAAATLTLKWDGNFEAGAIDVNATCQGDTPVNVGFGEVAFAATEDVPWEVESLEFSNIQAAACKDMNYEAAIKVNSGDWEKIVGGEIGANDTSVSVSLPEGVDADDVTDVAFTIFN